MQPFDDPAMVANYAQSTPRKVPGFADLHRMAALPLAERAPLIGAQHSYPKGSEAFRWLSRSVAFASGLSADRAHASTAAASMAERLPILSDGEDEAVLRQAGFSDAALFHAGFPFRGWVAAA
ncbi:hypothetical protein IGS68_29625 (plasmid) [Skermanella sp. TT6]|uniref:Uncharacterized protein n=1 Tax=Skermanella cutis TaxID=2775420 RepID=A0ABX7BFX9_9PROT|nr:hypothetical protein [Skermanella sp. TT6]QQP93277.1 hypothetical protein IGS68_29625 [Skermanella sp. TT6]